MQLEVPLKGDFRESQIRNLDGIKAGPDDGRSSLLKKIGLKMI